MIFQSFLILFASPVLSAQFHLERGLDFLDYPVQVSLTDANVKAAEKALQDSKHFHELVANKNVTFDTSSFATKDAGKVLIKAVEDYKSKVTQQILSLDEVKVKKFLKSLPWDKNKKKFTSRAAVDKIYSTLKSDGAGLHYRGLALLFTDFVNNDKNLEKFSLLIKACYETDADLTLEIHGLIFRNPIYYWFVNLEVAGKLYTAFHNAYGAHYQAKPSQ